MWKGKAYDLIRRRELTEDPVLRLFLRQEGMEGERGCHTPIGGKIAQLDRQERRTLDSPRSVRMSGRALRVCSALHAAHHFTDGAAIDGSKAGRVQETCEGDEVANTEYRLARAGYGIWEGVKPFGMVGNGIDTAARSRRRGGPSVEA